jgi:hypothetical protein
MVNDSTRDGPPSAAAVRTDTALVIVLATVEIRVIGLVGIE